MIALLFAALAPAFAADEPYIWVKQGVGASGWPAGLISDTKAQVRFPMYRNAGLVFRETYAGAGARLAVTPAFVDVGPRLSLAPIDIFDVDVQGSWHGYFGTSSSLMPFQAPAHKLEKERNARKKDAFAGAALSLSVAPTLKLAVGPIVAFDAWTIERWHFPRPDGVTEPYVYEPYRDTVMAWDDTFVQHQAAVMGMLAKGDEGPLLWVGATARDQRSLTAKDRSTVVGAVAMWRPGPANRTPTLTVQVLPYVKDADRVGRPPNLQAQLAFTREKPLKALRAP